jgi:hypothetical protein
MTPSPVRPRREITPALRARLQSLGATCSYELSPASVLDPKNSQWPSGQPGGGASGGAGQQLVFVHWVPPKREHGDAVAHACRALRGRGVGAVPHVPVTRFDDGASLAAFLSDLQGAAVSTVFLLGGNGKRWFRDG